MRESNGQHAGMDGPRGACILYSNVQLSSLGDRKSTVILTVHYCSTAAPR